MKTTEDNLREELLKLKQTLERREKEWNETANRYNKIIQELIHEIEKLKNEKSLKSF